jgi:hypothetical protein
VFFSGSLFLIHLSFLCAFAPLREIHLAKLSSCKDTKAQREIQLLALTLICYSQGSENFPRRFTYELLLRVLPRPDRYVKETNHAQENAGIF